MGDQRAQVHDPSFEPGADPYRFCLDWRRSCFGCTRAAATADGDPHVLGRHVVGLARAYHNPHRRGFRDPQPQPYERQGVLGEFKARDVRPRIPIHENRNALCAGGSGS